VDLQRRAAEYARRDGRMAEDDFFYAQQNARLIKDAELYYRTMFRGRSLPGIFGDEHMANTLDALGAALALRNGNAKVVIWAHNSHLGDARRRRWRRREWNLGQLARQRHGGECVAVDSPLTPGR